MKSDFVKACRRYENNIKAKRKLDKTSSCNSFFCPYKVEDSNGKTYYKKPSRGKISKWLKQRSNRAIRRHKDENLSGGKYKKIFDYWWELI